MEISKVWQFWLNFSSSVRLNFSTKTNLAKKFIKMSEKEVGAKFFFEKPRYLVTNTLKVCSGCQCEFGQIFFHHLHLLTQANATSIHERENIRRPFSRPQQLYLHTLSNHNNLRFFSYLYFRVKFLKLLGI